MEKEANEERLKRDESVNPLLVYPECVETLDQLCVGARVLIFDENRRRYNYPDGTRNKSGPIYECYFMEVTIRDESKTHWHLSTGAKVKKKDAGRYLFSKKSARENIILKKHRNMIIDRLRQEEDAEMIARIGRELGYEIK